MLWATIKPMWSIVILLTLESFTSQCVSISTHSIKVLSNFNHASDKSLLFLCLSTYNLPSCGVQLILGASFSSIDAIHRYGESPFEYALGESGGSLQLAIVNAQIKWPPGPNPPYPEALHQFVTWMLQPQAAVRPCIDDIIIHVDKLISKFSTWRNRMSGSLVMYYRHVWWTSCCYCLKCIWMEGIESLFNCYNVLGEILALAHLLLHQCIISLFKFKLC